MLNLTRYTTIPNGRVYQYEYTFFATYKTRYLENKNGTKLADKSALSQLLCVFSILHRSYDGVRFCETRLRKFYAYLYWKYLSKILLSLKA